LLGWRLKGTAKMAVIKQTRKGSTKHEVSQQHTSITYSTSYAHLKKEKGK
jgi:hypothetical protein